VIEPRENRMSNNNERYTTEELMARLKFVVGLFLALTLTGIVFVVLYSLMFITQPVGSQAPNDAEFFKLITPIATFLTGILSGIMLSKNPEEKKAEEPLVPPPVDSKEDEVIY
jgi:hypothetical protein